MSFDRDAQCRFIVASRNRPSWATCSRNCLRRDSRGCSGCAGDDRWLRRVTFSEAPRALLTWQSEPKGGRPSSHSQPMSKASLRPTASCRVRYTDISRRSFSNEFPVDVQHQLVRLALLPTLTPSAVEESLGCPQRGAAESKRTATNLGFVSPHEPPTFHPLLQEFLLEKLSERKDARARVHEAIQHLVREGNGRLGARTRLAVLLR